MSEFKQYIVNTMLGSYEFSGKYLPERETNNWHYYECKDGMIMHFRKEHMVCVEESELEEEDGQLVNNTTQG
jgi:hypothetical protein